MGVAKFVLALEQDCQFLGEQDTRQGLAIFALLVALGFGELRQHHLGGATIAFVRHQPGGRGQSLLDLAALALGVFTCLFLLRPADPVKAAVFAQVVDHPCPFLGGESAVKSVDAQAPRRNRGRPLVMKEARVVDQSFSPQQPRHLGLPPGAALQAATHQAGGTPDQVEGFPFLGGFRLVEGPYPEGDDMVRGEYRPADRGDADVKSDGDDRIALVLHGITPS